ncbi:MAG: hypothetical protein EU535_06335, partial [Promethearchaeota archaeon]
MSPKIFMHTKRIQNLDFIANYYRSLYLKKVCGNRYRFNSVQCYYLISLMTNLAILTPKEIEREIFRFMGMFIDTIKKVNTEYIKDNKHYKILQVDHPKKGNLIKLRIKLQEEEFRNQHSIFLLGTDNETSLNRLGLISTLKITEKRLLCFDGKNYEKQMEFYLELFLTPESNNYVIVFNSENKEEFEKIKAYITKKFENNGVIIEQMYNMSDILSI